MKGCAIHTILSPATRRHACHLGHAGHHRHRAKPGPHVDPYRSCPATVDEREGGGGEHAEPGPHDDAAQAEDGQAVKVAAELLALAQARHVGRVMVVAEIDSSKVVRGGQGGVLGIESVLGRDDVAFVVLRRRHLRAWDFLARNKILK